MFSYKHYVPILKAKEGEFKALQDTFDLTKDLMTPLLEITTIPWNYEEGHEAKTIDAHLSKIARKMFDAWGETRRFFVDSDLLDGDTRMLDGTTHHLEFLFNDFRANRLTAIPTTGLDRHADYKQAVARIVAGDKRGICLRLENSDLTDPDLKAKIDADLLSYNVTPKETDLVIDLKSIDGNTSDLVVFSLSTFINIALPYVNDWRSLTIAASSFPIDLSDISANTIDRIDRIEWALWVSLLATRLLRKPSFGDYSIAHTDIFDLDPRMITISASIRYTCDTFWLIVRGRSTKKHGFGQYHDLCASLIARPEYFGSTYSWGDNYIYDCAQMATGTGNPTTWRRVGNNHHFQVTKEQIAMIS